MSSQAIAQRDVVQEVCARIAAPEFGEKIAQALPGNVTLDRFTRVTLTAIQQNPELVTAERKSLYNSVIRCAQDGLIPDGREAALVIFKVKGELKVQYLPMVGGLRKIAAKHDIVLTAFVVHARDEFLYELGATPKVEHRPPPLDQDRGDPIGAYAVATERDGTQYLEVMSRAEIEKVRAVSRAATSEYGPWVNWWGEMARKTVARRLFKQLPLGDLDQQSAAIVRHGDDEYEFRPDGPGMTADEANLSVAASATVDQQLPDDGAPDDVLTGEVVE